MSVNSLPGRASIAEEITARLEAREKKKSFDARQPRIVQFNSAEPIAMAPGSPEPSRSDRPSCGYEDRTLTRAPVEVVDDDHSGCCRSLSKARKRAPGHRSYTIKQDRQALRARMTVVRRRLSVLAPANDMYDWTKSTRDNYQSSADDPQHGQHTEPYSGIRDGIDKEYHGVYTLARQAVQDALIQNVLDISGGAQERPWIVFTAGAMGAGKSRTMGWLSEKEIFPLSQVRARARAPRRYRRTHARPTDRPLLTPRPRLAGGPSRP